MSSGMLFALPDWPFLKYTCFTGISIVSFISSVFGCFSIAFVWEIVQEVSWGLVMVAVTSMLAPAGAYSTALPSLSAVFEVAPS